MPKGGHNRVPNALKRKRGTFRNDRAGARAKGAPPANAPEAVVYLADLTKDERGIVLQVEAECDGIGVKHQPFGLWKELTARTLAEARKVDPDMAPTARVKLYQAAHGLLAAGGLTPASFDKVAAGDERKPEEGPRVSLRGDEGKMGAIQ